MTKTRIKMEVCACGGIKRLISLSPSCTWRLSLFVLVLGTVSAAGQDGGGGSVSPFTPSDANQSPSGRIFQCDDPKTVNGKEVVSCRKYTEIPRDIKTRDTLKILDMSGGNNLQNMKEGELQRAHLPMLTHLNLQNCQIHSIERGTFNGGNVLVELDISKNRIEVLDPQVFEGLLNLKTLILKGNPINRFQTEAIFPPLGITSLDISGTDLDDVPQNVFRNLKDLGKLQLNDNKLTKLDWKVFSETRVLNSLSLGGNLWHCDCHVKFLMQTLRERHLMNAAQSATCHSSPTATRSSTTRKSLAGMKWSDVEDSLACIPEIKQFSFKGSDVLPPGGKSQDSDNERHHYDPHHEEKVELGQDVHFTCEYSGYPHPEIKWLKNDMIIDPNEINDESARAAPRTQSIDSAPSNSDTTNKPASSDESSSLPPSKPKFQLQQGTFDLQKSMDQHEKDRNYKFRDHLVLRRVDAKDRGEYSCLVRNVAGVASKSVHLNLTVAGGEDDVFFGAVGGNKGGMKVWMWVLVGLLCVLIVLLLLLIICFDLRRREKRKQEGFRKVVHDKLKDSNVDLGDLVNMKTTSPSSPQKGQTMVDGSTPLLDNRSEASTLLITDTLQRNGQLPDVALGNAELIRNSQIFSPKPPPAINGYPGPNESRKEFFARQISEPYLRPGSSMSLQRPAGVDAAQRRYIFANQHYPTAPVPGGDEHHYAIPENIRIMPRSSSAMSMTALPENDLRRQLFLRQYSQPHPAYATAMRPYPNRRHPSIGSEHGSENMGNFTYSTLPRRPMRQQNWSRPTSPTGSTCSNYSTLSWRPGYNPSTGVYSDGVGPRRDAGGGSTSSLNRTPDLVGTGSIVGINGGALENVHRPLITPGAVIPKVKVAGRNPRLGHSRTPSSLTRGHNDFFSFEPIQEVESSEGASNLNLEKLNGSQPPNGYTTQSLARDPKYRKKKPPPIAFIPATLKEPSRAFEHLKGRSVSPALRNSEISQKATNTSGPPPVTNGSGGSGPVHVLESPIDEVLTPPLQAEKSPKVPESNRLSKSFPPPPPPPKPKRNPDASTENLAEDANKSPSLVVNDGTVV